MSEFAMRQLWQERDRIPPRAVRLLHPVQHWGEPAWTAVHVSGGGPVAKGARATCILRESTMHIRWEMVRS